MNISEILKRDNLSQAEFARKTNIPKSSLSSHIKHELTNGQQGRRMGYELCHRVMAVYPELTLKDLKPEWAERLNGG